MPIKRPILNYATSPKVAPFNRILRLTAAACCSSGLAVGLIIIWYGADGLWYAATEAPARDRGGDFFGAGLLATLGLVVAVFSTRWLGSIIRSVRRSGTQRR